MVSVHRAVVSGQEGPGLVGEVLASLLEKPGDHLRPRPKPAGLAELIEGRDHRLAEREPHRERRGPLMELYVALLAKRDKVVPAVVIVIAVHVVYLDLLGGPAVDTPVPVQPQPFFAVISSHT